MKLIIQKIIFSFLAVSLVVLAGWFIFKNIPTAFGYGVYNNKFIVQDSTGNEIFSISDIGLISDEGGNIGLCDVENYDWPDGWGVLPADQKPQQWGNGWEVRRSSDNNIILYLESRDGYGILHLAGQIVGGRDWNNDQTPGLDDPGGSDHLILKNKDGEIFAYLTPDGDLYLRGGYQDPIWNMDHTNIIVQEPIVGCPAPLGA